MSNFYHELREDQFAEEDYLNKRKKNQSTDSRPQIATNMGHVELSERGENDKIIKKIRKNELEKEQNRKTIMDMPLRDILEKTSEVSSDFWSDYKTNLSEVEINRKANDPNYKQDLSSIIGIHIVALINYTREADHVLYMGILFVIISIILYVFNIII
jgi:hypothetical protein